MVRNLAKKEKGFTLVELLIVVAIIGVLSTVGIPTFRRMIQKSKKSEAKVELGGLYTAESSFYAEYGGYGNHLARIGFQIDGAGSGAANSANLIYTVGFAPTAGACTGSANEMPALAAAGLGNNINALYPAYYANWTASDTAGDGNVEAVNLTLAGGSVMGNTTITNCQGLATGLNYAAFTAAAYSGQNVGAQVNDVWSSNQPGPTDSDRFVAGAWGVVAPGGNRVTPPLSFTDMWAISDTRFLMNTNDGIN
jgi:type IV pilus assembly protein PilA